MTDAAVPDAWHRAVQTGLLPWFAAHQRRMPWRSNRSGYRVWISELMLQQTRVDQATPYFRRFMKRFPSLRSLAEAPLDDVLKQWEGLGYYSRARNLHRAAKIVRESHGGRLPRDVATLLTLPGIGPYTARAIASLAFGADEAVVDGNVIRVLSRWGADDRDPATSTAKAFFQERADALLPAGASAPFNEAMMELGATVCTPRQPDCGHCPLSGVCEVTLRGLDASTFPRNQKKAPVPTVRVGAGIILNGKGQFLIARRPESGMLGGLWEFPGGKVEEGESLKQCIARELEEELGVCTRVGRRVVRVKHAYSHFKLDMDVHWAWIESGTLQAIGCTDFRWVTLADVSDVALSRADLKVIEALEDTPLPLGME